MKRIYFYFLITCVFMSSSLFAEIGIWTSASELAAKPTSGEPWEAVIQAANSANPNFATVSDQNSNNNAEILAAAIAYARDGNITYRDKVIAACKKLVAGGKPADRTLAWARETGAYAMAADLVDYRTPEFELWLRNMAETYVASDGRTMLVMFKRRPNNWGTMGFGSLCAIYAFLQDTSRLTEIRDYFNQSVSGPKPSQLDYGSDISWHPAPGNLRLINPKGSVKQDLNIDGVIPDDMRRNGSFSNPPPTPTTSYHWEVLQGIVMGARILERAGMPIWAESDSAIHRAVYILQVEWENEFGNWKAEGDDLWMLPFIDDAYGTNYAEGQEDRVWKYGKNTGWPYVIWDDVTGMNDRGGKLIPGNFEIFYNFPNPFNSSTRIQFTLDHASEISLEIFDIAGKKISVLAKGFHPTGKYEIDWDAETYRRFQLSSGIYLCKLQTPKQKKVIKMVYTR